MLRLHSAWEVQLPVGISDIALSDRGSGRLLRIRGDRQLWLRLMHLLSTGIEVSALLRELDNWPDRGRDARRALEYLQEQGAVTSRSIIDYSNVNNLFDRQIRFFDLFETESQSGVDFNEKLQDSTVVLVGLGGYGVWLATMLYRMGVRRLIGIDDDRVEESNLARQFMYTTADIGRPKVEAFAEHVQTFKNGASFEPVMERVRDVHQFADLVTGADLIINAFGYSVLDQPEDRLDTFHIIAKGCEVARAPSIAFGGSWHGPIRVPGTDDACAGCLTTLEPFRSRLIHNPLAPRLAPAPAIASRLGMNACISAWEVVRFLSGLTSPLRSTLLMFDSMKYQSLQLTPLKPSNECYVCRDYRGTV